MLQILLKSTQHNQKRPYSLVNSKVKRIKPLLELFTSHYNADKKNIYEISIYSQPSLNRFYNKPNQVHHTVCKCHNPEQSL